MKKAQWIDLFRGIKKSKGRYISLIFIVALGTAFFAGVRSAEPDMIASADKYYDESNLMDVRILGTFICTRFLGLGLVAAWGCMIGHNLLLFALFAVYYATGKALPKIA